MSLPNTLPIIGMTFLVLAPETQGYKPTAEKLRSASISSAGDKNTTTQAVDATAAPATTSEQTRVRRSSSISSASSSASRLRFLKLGPVHFGGDPAESDFVELDDAWLIDTFNHLFYFSYNCVNDSTMGHFVPWNLSWREPMFWQEYSGRNRNCMAMFVGLHGLVINQ